MESLLHGRNAYIRVHLILTFIYNWWYKHPTFYTVAKAVCFSLLYFNVYMGCK